MVTRHADDHRTRRAQGRRGRDARHLRLARGDPEGRRHVRRRDRRPPVDPRRRRAREGHAVRRHDRARLPHAQPRPRRSTTRSSSSRASPSPSTTASTRCASRRPCRSRRKVRASPKVKEVTDIPGGAQCVFEVTFEREGAEKPVCVAETRRPRLRGLAAARTGGAGGARRRRRGRCPASVARASGRCRGARPHRADVAPARRRGAPARQPRAGARPITVPRSTPARAGRREGERARRPRAARGVRPGASSAAPSRR